MENIAEAADASLSLSTEQDNNCADLRHWGNGVKTFKPTHSAEKPVS